MTEQAKVPAIRFAGFTDPWEQRKFSDIVDVCSGKDYKHLEEGPIPVYGTGGFMTSVDEALSYDRDAVGIGRKGTIDKPYLLKAPFWTVDTLFYAIPKSDMDLEFVHCSFLNVDWKSKDESTGLPSLSKEAINETIALVPSFNEQSRLGEFFSDLDSLITLHQRKYDKLVILKKSMLEKMFPKDGESVPEIRFAGFTDPWEQRKFSDIVDVCSGKDYKHLEEGPIPVYGTGGFMTSVDEALSYDRDAVGIGRKGTIDKPYLLKAPFWTVDTLFYAIPKSDMDLEFVHCSFLNVDWKSKDESTGLPSLSKEAINETIALVPSFNEQSRLGEFFSDLDSLITLHQRKYDKLVILKKSMLEKMFPKDGESVPEIRFAGFTDPWEQRKLIMVAPLQRGFDLPAEKIIPGVYPVMMSNGIGAYHNEYKVKGPGVVTGRSGTIGNLQYVESAFWPHNTTLWVTKFYGNHPKFIYYLYEKIDLKRYKAGSGVPTLNRNDVHDTMVFFPASRKEQELISAVLTYLDDLITLHQRKRLSIRQRSPVWS